MCFSWGIAWAGILVVFFVVVVGNIGRQLPEKQM